MTRWLSAILLPTMCATSLASAQVIQPPARSVTNATEVQVGSYLQPPSYRSYLQAPTYRLWIGRAEGASGDEDSQTPTLTVFRPYPGHDNGTAVIIAPGGGYMALAATLEGRQVAEWFASRGVTAFVLKYRVGKAARLPIPLADGKRAVRFVRANAAQLKVDPDRIGMMGFSAGGHLAAMTAAQADKGAAADRDPVQRVSSRPDFLVLAYPWLEATVLDAKGQSQYCTFARQDCVAKSYEKYMPLRFVTNDMPPTFLYHTTTDALVDVGGSLAFYDAVRRKGVPAELHMFAKGEHGTGLGGSDPALERWPELLGNWLRALGMFDKEPKAK